MSWLRVVLPGEGRRPQWHPGCWSLALIVTFIAGGDVVTASSTVSTVLSSTQLFAVNEPRPPWNTNGLDLGHRRRHHCAIAYTVQTDLHLIE